MIVEFDFEVKILRRCGLYLFLCIQQPSSFRLLYHFPNNLHYSNFHNFSKSNKNTLSVKACLHCKLWAAWCLTSRPGDLSRPHFNVKLACAFGQETFFQPPADLFDFFGYDFCRPLPIPIAIAGHSNSWYCVLSNIFENFKFWKLFDKDAISRIRGFYDCDV